MAESTTYYFMQGIVLQTATELGPLGVTVLSNRKHLPSVILFKSLESNDKHVFFLSYQLFGTEV